ncbi:hypothetical protein KC19_VG108200 [Ceratodon purpureus]|uniref:Uncharacterized protein n=1 Tax=Ceratodon purpureus TaxID=3225 RepID=A0A8T0HNU0_CERPU|nr:hypothetical protein KC19_VG108200 [Ceratodon purpureus]
MQQPCIGLHLQISHLPLRLVHYGQKILPQTNVVQNESLHFLPSRVDAGEVFLWVINRATALTSVRNLCHLTVPSNFPDSSWGKTNPNGPPKRSCITDDVSRVSISIQHPKNFNNVLAEVAPHFQRTGTMSPV